MKRRDALSLLLLGAVPLELGCSKKPDKIVSAGEGKSLGDDDIDREPLALLPGGAVGIFALDAPKLAKSQFGQKLLTIAKGRTPVPPSANFDPERDLTYLYIGVYSMQGADLAGVAIGNFDKAAIEKSADGTQLTPLGTPVVKSQYANRTLYTSLNVGFVPLTKRTVLFGNETGIRRALDRIKEGRVRNQAPGWFRELAKTPNAPIVAGFDLRAQPITDAARQQMPFLNGLQTARMIGNFESPGVNVAGTGTYGDEKEAAAGAASMLQVKDMLANWGWLASLLGITQPIRQLDAKADGKDCKFVAGLDAQAVGQLLDQANGYLGVPNQPKVIPASTSPGVSGDPPKK